MQRHNYMAGLLPFDRVDILAVIEMTDAIRRMLETTAKLWGTPPYLVAGCPVDKGGCELSAPATPENAVKHK